VPRTSGAALCSTRLIVQQIALPINSVKALGKAVSFRQRVVDFPRMGSLEVCPFAVERERAMQIQSLPNGAHTGSRGRTRLAHVVTAVPYGLSSPLPVRFHPLEALRVAHGVSGTVALGGASPLSGTLLSPCPRPVSAASCARPYYRRRSGWGCRIAGGFKLVPRTKPSPQAHAGPI
jgi:hypothetical protein